MNPPILKKRKIGILIGSIITGAGGAEKQAVLLSGVLASCHEVRFIVLNGNKISPRLHKQLSEQQSTHSFLKGSLFARLHQLISYLKDDKPDILFCYLTSSNFIGGILGKVLRIPYVIGGIRSSKMERLKLIIQRFTHNHLTRYTIFNNYRGSDSFTDIGFNPLKIRTIPNGIEVEEEFYRRKEKNHLHIITVGRFVEAKDFKTALHSIQLLTGDLPETIGIKYLLVGFGELEDQIRVWIGQLHLENHVQIVHNPSNLKEIYQQADIYLCTSYFEGLSNSILEAMNYGLPIVGTNVGDNSHLILDNKTGYLTRPYDHPGIAEKLKELVLNYPKRISYGEKGFEHCRENYSIERFTSNYLTFIDSLIA